MNVYKKYNIDDLLICVHKNDHKRIHRAFNFSKKYLSDIKRRSGESYFEHGYQLADTLHEVSNDPVLFITLLLHDLPLHPDWKELIKVAPITKEEKDYIMQMHSLRGLHIDKRTKDLDHVISEFTKDSRIILMRMVHRLNDVRHIKKFNPQLRQKIAEETLHMYTAIAGRLGLHAWRYEMEDICFKILHPKIAKNLEKQFKISKQLDWISLKDAKKFLQKKFQDHNFDSKIDLRIKKLYSTYRKMVLKNRTFKELTDRLALRIIVPTVDDCYRALGIVHNTMHPIPGKLKDYIGAPKENGYRSIHTVVYPLPGVTEMPIEIQIRTQQMHWECEYGFAAHHKYKDIKYSFHRPLSRVSLFRNLEILRQETRSPEQFKDALRTYFEEDRLIIFDHKNNLFHLKKPATALDFAFLVYKERCSRLKTVRINGREQTLDILLSDGDVVEAKFGRELSFNRKWRSLCRHKTSLDLIERIKEKTK